MVNRITIFSSSPLLKPFYEVWILCISVCKTKDYGSIFFLRKIFHVQHTLFLKHIKRISSFIKKKRICSHRSVLSVGEHCARIHFNAYITPLEKNPERLMDWEQQLNWIEDKFYTAFRYLDKDNRFLNLDLDTVGGMENTTLFHKCHMPISHRYIIKEGFEEHILCKLLIWYRCNAIQN
jgi:hypothetical protein